MSGVFVGVYLFIYFDSWWLCRFVSFPFLLLLLLAWGVLESWPSRLFMGSWADQSSFCAKCFWI